MKDGYFTDQFVRYKSKGVLIDSNLLLLYVVGKYSPEKIAKFKRTSVYTVDDYLILEKIVRFFKMVVTTPNILTEVSNLARQLPEWIRKDYFDEFRKEIVVLNEEYIESRVVCNIEQFPKLGLTDGGIIEAARGNYLVLTDDFPLYNTLLNLDIDAVNINHIRAARWFGY